MNSTKSAFQLLTLLLSANGTIIEAKSSLLIDFLNDYCDELEFDPKIEIEKITKLNENDKFSKLMTISKSIHTTESNENKEALLSYAFGIMSVNTTLTDKDISLLETVAKQWNVNLHLL